MGAEAVVGRIVGILDVNDTKFTSGINKAKTQFSGLHGDMTSKSKAITGAISGIGSAMVALGAVAFLKGAIDEAIRDEVQFVKLKTAVHAAGLEWGVYAARMEEAGKAGILLGYSDDTTTESLAKLTTATGSAETALRDIALAQDLARATGMDLVAASSLIAKVEGGRIGVAARVLTFLKTTMTTEQALSAIRERTAGQAEAFANTAAGASARQAASYELLQKTIGERLLPAFTGITDAATAVIVAFGNADKATQTFAITLAGLGVIATKLGGLPGFIISIGAAVNYTADTMITQGAAGFGSYVQGMLGTRDASEGLVRSIIQAVPATRSLYEMSLGAGTVQRIMGDAIGGSAGKAGTLADVMSILATTTGEAAAETRGYTDALIYQLNNLTLTQTAEQTALTDKIAVKSATKALADAVKTYGKNSNEARLAQLNLTAAQNKSKDSAQVSKDAALEAGAAARIAAAAYDKLKTAVASANARLAATPGAAVRVPVNGRNNLLLADGGYVPPRPGGTPALIAEAGVGEWAIPNRRDANSLGLLAQATAGLGVSGGGGDVRVTGAAGGGTVNHFVFNITGYTAPDRRLMRAEIDAALSSITRSSRSYAFGG